VTGDTQTPASVATADERRTSPPSDKQIDQLLLRLRYQQLAREGASLPDFADVEFTCHSQNGEDGILLYLFALLGTTNRRAIEICAGDGIECNVANLIVNHGWQALLIDGDPSLVGRGREFYSACQTTFSWPPHLLDAWVTADNVNELVTRAGFSGSIDLLSLDMDGNDYWVWKALTCVSPRVVVLEFNTCCGPHERVAMRYRPHFRIDPNSKPNRFGASLPAFVALGRDKGYRLVGVQSLGFNAFFVRTGLGEEFFPEVASVECYARTERMRDWTPARLDNIVSGGIPWDPV
jgi:hypothetical protein